MPGAELKTIVSIPASAYAVSRSATAAAGPTIVRASISSVLTAASASRLLPAR